MRNSAENWSKILKRNHTIRSIVPQFVPIVQVVNNKIVSQIGKIADFQSIIPSKINIIITPYNGLD